MARRSSPSITSTTKPCEVALRQPFIDRGRHQEVHVAVDRAEVIHAVGVRRGDASMRRFYRSPSIRVNSDRLLARSRMIESGQPSNLKESIQSCGVHYDTNAIALLPFAG